MGLTYVEIDVSNVTTPDQPRQMRLLVDSGAIYSVVPRAVLQELGIQVVAEETFWLANGERISRQKGVALFRYGDRIGGSDVIFGEAGDADLLGALTLEALGLSLDPLRRELNPMRMMLALEKRPL